MSDVPEEQLYSWVHQALLRHLGPDTQFESFLKRQVGTAHGAYTFQGHQALLPIVRLLPKQRELWVLKAAQVGLSTLAMGWCAYLASARRLEVGYALPTKIFAARFFRTRFRPLLRELVDPRLTQRITEDVGLVQFSREGQDSHLYMLGLENLGDAISIPLDVLCYDEVDVMNQENMIWAEDRLAASTFGQRLYFSVGMNPGLGIDAGYQASDQRVWVVRCSRCGRDDQVLEENFPDGVMRSNGYWQLVCLGCHIPLNVEDDGRWVARYPERDATGFRVPQLIIPHISLDHLMSRWTRAQGSKSRQAKFRSSVLALPDAGDRQRITHENLLRSQADHPESGSVTWTVGGADVGDTCHVAFADLADGKLRFVHLEAIESDRMIKVMGALIQRMNCRCFVIDAKPFRSEVRRLARLFPDVVVLQYFKGGALTLGEEEHDGVVYRTVSEDRDESLDAYCDLFGGADPQVIFPRAIDGKDFVVSEVAMHHITGSQKVETADALSGKWRSHYRKQCENHYLMACNNARKAMALTGMGRAAGGIGALPVFSRP